jgi:sugar-specific transcriptional regulator TrmB
MKSKMYILVVAAVVAACLIAARLAMSIPGKDRNYYAVEPEITTPEYKTDAARAIDAYERLMERYMDLAESNLQQAGADYQVVVSRLDSLDSRLEEVSSRLARIEKKLGVEPDANGTAKLKAVK